MADAPKPADILHNLVETCRDGENGYIHAAANVQDPELQLYFREQSLERALFAKELEQEVMRLGDGPSGSSGSVAGLLHRAWFSLKGTLGGSDHTILESVEQGEDSAKNAYKEALSSSLPDDVLRIIARQNQSIRAAHDKVRELRDAGASRAA